MQTKQELGRAGLLWAGGTDWPGDTKVQSPAHGPALPQPFPLESPLEGLERGAEIPPR